MTLWRWPALCSALGLKTRSGPDVGGIQIDSRRVGPGDLFVALSGDPGARFQPSRRSERDGHDFVGAAFDAGAVGALVHRPEAYPGPVLQVGDTLTALWDLGRAGRARLQGSVVAVTGSSGKTTFKQFLQAALSAYASEGSLNNHLGVPWSLALTPEHSDCAIYELGTNHPGEIAPLAQLVQPRVAVVLNIQNAHIGNFDSFQSLVTEKLAIHRGLMAGGVLVVEDLVDITGLPDDLPLIRFGRTSSADFRLLSIDNRRARFDTPAGALQCQIPGGGSHRAQTMSAVLAVLWALGEPVEPGLSLPDRLVPPGRGNQIQAGGRWLIDDSYNANPHSMEAALRLLSEQPGRKIAVLGEMFELGERSGSLHAELARACQAIDVVICVGAGMTALQNALPNPESVLFFATASGTDRLNLISKILEISKRNDQILVKGSNGVFWTNQFVQHLARALEHSASD